MRSNSPTSIPLVVHSVALIGVVLIALVLLCATYCVDSQIWSGWPESNELRQPVYTERVDLNAFFRTRANVWSNLAYVWIGFYALAFSWQDLCRKREREYGYLVNTPGLSFVFGLACCYLGVGSGLFHASLTRFGQQLDVAAMYSPLLVLIAIGIGRWIPRFRIGTARSVLTWPISVLLAVVTSILLFQYKWSMSSSKVLATLIGVLIATVSLSSIHDQMRRKPKMDERWLIASFVALVFGVACRQLDIAGRWSGADAWLQGHAFWHFLTSLSLACTYFFFRSEIGQSSRAHQNGNVS